jgi:hypothetical protein
VARWSCARLVSVVAACASAASASDVESPVRSRTLGEHVFIQSQYVPGPFATTSFGTGTTVGVGEAEAPRYDRTGTQVGVRNYTLGAVGQGFDYSWRIFPDVAIRLEASGLVYSGTNGASALVAGSTGQYEADLGLIGGRNFGAVRVAAVVGLGYSPEFSLTPANAVLQAIDEGSFDDVAAYQRVERVVVAPGVSAAWGLHPAVGLVGEARYLWTRRTGGDDPRQERQGVLLGGVADFDLKHLLRVPVGTMLLGRTRIPVGDSGLPRRYEVGTGLFYTGRPHLLLGAEVVWAHGELRPNQRPTLSTDAAIATLRLRYYW